MPDETTALQKTVTPDPPPTTVATQDVLRDPLSARMPDPLDLSFPPPKPHKVDRHSPLDRQSVMEHGMQGDGSLVTAVDRSGDTKEGVLSMTQAFLHQKRSRPGLSDDMLWKFALEYDVNPGGEYTELRGSSPIDYDGEKKAYVVGNEDYVNEKIPDLPGAAADASAMVGHYKSKGYKTFHVKNVEADKMKNGVEVFGKMQLGDSGVFYYAGHGTGKGLIGVDGKIMANSVISSATRDATASGAKMDVVVDACRSGSIQAAYEDEFGPKQRSETMPHVDATNSAELGYGLGGAVGFDAAYEHMITDGNAMSEGWKIRNPKPMQVEEY